MPFGSKVGASPQNAADGQMQVFPMARKPASSLVLVVPARRQYLAARLWWVAVRKVRFAMRVGRRRRCGSARHGNQLERRQKACKRHPFLLSFVSNSVPSRNEAENQL